MNLSEYGWPLTDPHIVSSNRDGRFMPQQQTVLIMHAPSPFWSWLFALFLLALTLSPFLFVIREGVPPMIWLLYIPIFGGMSLLIIGSAFVYTRRSNRLRHELKHGPIAHSPGRVTWDGRQYVATVPGKQLKGATGKLDLLPGDYHFYFLPHSGFLLSAEPLAVDQVQGQAQVSQNLAQTFSAKAGDFPLNRTGRLTGRQRMRLLWYSIGYALLALLCVLFIVGAYFGFRAGNEEMSPWLAGCYLLFGIAIIIYAFSLTATRLLDALAGRCHTVTGRVEIVTRTAGRSVTMHYLVQGIELNVPHKAYFTTVQGIPYHVYYAPRSKIVVAVEPVHS